MGEVLSKHEIDSLLKALEVEEESMLEIKIQKQISMVETEDYKALERMNKINQALVKDPVFGVPF